MLFNQFYQKRINLFLLALFVIGGVILFSAPALAQTTDDNTNQQYVGPLGYKLQIPIGNIKTVDDLGDYIRNFYNYFMLAAAVLATFMIMFGGYLWLTALGNREKISRAKEFIFSAITGLLLALLSYVLLYTINPSIVELKPLNVAIVKPPAWASQKLTLCPWGTLDKDSKPVQCEEVSGLASGDIDKGADQCTGVLSGDPDRVCQITEDQRGSKMGMIKGSLPVRGGYAETNNELPCGVLGYNDKGWSKTTKTWMIGSNCENKDYGHGNQYKDRCIINGDPIIDTKNSAKDNDCNINEAQSIYCKDEKMKDYCGCITNMMCYPGGIKAAGSTCNTLSIRGTCKMSTTAGNVTFNCDKGVQSQIDGGFVDDYTKETYKKMHDILKQYGEEVARVSAFSDNSLGRCVTSWSCGVCGGGSCDPDPKCNCSTSNSCEGTCCGHREDSTHYCHKTGANVGKSMAIDFGDEANAQVICEAAKTVLSDGYINAEGSPANHIHLSFGNSCDDGDSYNLSTTDCGNY